MTTQRKALAAIIDSKPYKTWATKHAVDAYKVSEEWKGRRRPSAGDPFAAALITLIRANPATAAPPPPPATDRYEYWRSQGFFMSWGLYNGTWSETEMARKAKSFGAEWVAINDIPMNRERMVAIKSALRAQGLSLAVWRWADTIASAKEAILFWEPAAWIENVEHFTWEDGLPNAIRAFRPNMPLGLITNFSGCGATKTGGYDKAQSSPWIEAGFACIPESYMVNESGVQATLSPDRLTWTANAKLGWPLDRIFPCFGLYRTNPEYYDVWRWLWPQREPGMAFYAEEVARYPFHSWYLLESL